MDLIGAKVPLQDFNVRSIRLDCEYPRLREISGDNKGKDTDMCAGIYNEPWCALEKGSYVGLHHIFK
ncbi:hypothetical protein BRCON_0660 [Candidatus Sumerlaea chitinivorans]|uniref:Uncharacterized protein n=1 Tax=Sumerlaea chitinivorans TaxID=2250252 RepID=A0A2Z4Y2J5_SUMC1|nr:hypothetical protein BRCON_0660 [Candidatus Sumerlaea chitinivorans]